MLRIHKDVFSEYLSDAYRWTSPSGQPRMEDWREWLDHKGIERCAMTGFYGEYGHEVGYVGDCDEPIRLDGLYPARYMAGRQGFELQVEDDVIHLVAKTSEASTITNKGDIHLSFSDGVFNSKEQRVEMYLENKTERV